MAAPAISAREVGKRFGARQALHGVSCDIASGETVVLWGPNGAGKTTALRCMLGLMPFEGTIQVFGHDAARDGKRARRHLGYVPQELGLYAEQTVAEALGFYARLRGRPRESVSQQLAAWHLEDQAAVKIRALSGGTKQRVALAAALLGDPPALLLDEPASHLDVSARGDLLQQLDVLKRAGKTLVLCSHRISDVLRLADRVIILERGRKIAEGPPDRVRDHLQETVILALQVAAGRQAEAAALLRARGFDLTVNHVLLWVRVMADRKMEPLRVLAESGVAVMNFDVDHEAASASSLERMADGA